MFELNVLRKKKLAYQFETDKLTIGSDKSEKADFTLSGIDLAEEHLEIFWDGEGYKVENLCHDPHTRINGKPFWQKTLHHGDLIELGEVQLQFFILSPGKKGVSKPPPPQLEVTSTPPNPEQEAPTLVTKEEKTAPYSDSHWHLWVLFFSVVFLFVTLFTTSLYFSLSEKTLHQRLFAARGLADIAITLKYAQVNGIDPPYSNWLDPHFLKEVGQKVIPENLTQYQWIDRSGKFTDAPYLLRIYADHGFDRFLLIAQPEPSWNQWLIPKPTLVVDSDHMEMKELSNLRDLNRLLVSTSGFMGVIQSEVVQLISASPSLSLNTLAIGREKRGFFTPEELSVVDPEGEYCLLNAPRYYLWHEPLINLTQQLSLQTNEKEIEEKIETYLLQHAPFDKMIFYASKGIQSAIFARKILVEKWPECSHLLGYIEFDPGENIKESHLLMMHHKPGQTGDIQAHEEKLHPFYEDLTSLVEERKFHLQPATEKMIQLFEQHQHTIDRLFFIHHKKIFDDYKELLKKEQKRLDEAIKESFYNYVLEEKSLTLPQFFNILESHQLDLGYEEVPAYLVKNPEEQLHIVFTIMNKTLSLKTLDQALAIGSDLLTEENFQDPSILESYKKQLQLLCTYKLESLLWRTPSGNSKDKSKQDLQWMVGRILKNGQIQDAEGREFYLSQILEDSYNPLDDE